MKNEIGSEFWTEVHTGKGIETLLPQWDATVFTLSGRTALEIIVEDIIFTGNAKTVYMPSYCCHTMIEPFIRHGIKIIFYDVYLNEEGLHCDFQPNTCDIVFLIDYFGFLNPATRDFAEQEHRSGKTIIYDATHSMFDTASRCYADYIMGSFRKWFGVNAGFASKGSPWTGKRQLRKNDQYCDLRNRAFDMKAQFIDTKDNSLKPIFLNIFHEAEELLEKDYSYYAPDFLSVHTLETVDVRQIRDCRRDNAVCLIKGLKDVRDLSLPYKSLDNDVCPLFVPVCTDDRDGLRRYLISRDIYCPVHWPVSPLHNLNDRSQQIYDTELSVICDQRYDKNDIFRIIDSVRHYMNSKS